MMDPELSQRSKRVLIVEDDLEIREALALVLRDEGYLVDVSDNGLSALEQLRAGLGPDVIVLDLNMPVMDGWQFRTEVRRDARWASIPVVAVSADDSAKASAVHAEAYLQKPFHPKELLEVLQRVLAQHERRELTLRLVEAERMAAIGRIAAGVGHEINNPLAYVTLNLRMIQEHVGEDGTLCLPGLPGIVAEALEGLDRIRRIVDDLRTLSRRESDPLVPVNVERLVERALATLDHQLRPLARIERKFAGVPSFSGHGDRLMGLFLNLIANAAQAMGEVPRELHVLRVETSFDAREVTVSIEDTGPGIAADVLPYIFDPFFTTKQTGAGTGLGLSISRQLVVAHGGEIRVDSAVGQGTRVFIRFPRRGGEGSVTGKPARPSAPGSGRARILVIDDERFVRNAIGRALKPHHDVVDAESVAEARARFSKGERFDLILCDVIMPSGSGGDLYDILRDQAPDQLQRLFFMTGGAFTGQANAVIERAQARVLLKPLNLDELRRLAAAAAKNSEGSGARSESS